MREIKFRGKRIDNGEWVFGDLVHSFWRSSVIYINDQEVDPETIGQYIGLIRDNVYMYEGDIVKVIDYIGNYTLHQIKYCAEEWNYPAFELCPDLGVDSNAIAHCIASDEEDIVVIGNIHEHPELLTAGGQSEA